MAVMDSTIIITWESGILFALRTSLLMLPYNGFNPKGWYYMPIGTSGLNLLGTFNDADSRFIPFVDYKDGGSVNRVERYHDMTYYTAIKHLP